MAIAAAWRSPAVLTWLTRTVLAAAVVAIALQWVNSRITIVRQNQGSSRNVVPTGYTAFHSMATGLHEGRIGQIDLPAMELYWRPTGPAAPYERLAPGAAHHWVNFYTFDVGYAFIVEAARLMFPALPDNYLRALALQLVVDATTVAIIFFVFSQWNAALGVLAAWLYSTNQIFFDLVSVPYYYYWDIPLTCVVLGAMLVARRRPAEAMRWLTLAALALGFGVWLRASWWPLSLFWFAVAASSRPLRGKLLIPAIAFAIVATPQAARSSLARGQLTLTTRSVWHVALVGLGYYPNPYGLRVQDESVFELTRQKYGVTFKYEDYFEHDQAAKKELASIWRNDRGFVIRSVLGRLKESLTGNAATVVRSYVSVSNVMYRLACLVGFVAMMRRGGEKRLVAIAAAGSYGIYVVLTCIFYYVGLDYGGVPEVTLLILFMGGIEAALYALRRALGTFAPLRRLAPMESTAMSGAYGNGT